MRTTITLDDELLVKAIEYSGITEKSKLVAYALGELVRQELTKRFLALEGTMPELEHSTREVRYDRVPLAAATLNDSHE